jgi:peptidoglycan/LPS O-acetylase OafA/YrhL
VTGEETWRLGHRPGLDGLRGVAVLLVIASHAGFNRWALTGPVGVTMFFTLSGFLITSLLLAEQTSTGRISIRGFYRRRARRLVPAMLAAIMLGMLVEFLVLDRISWFLVIGSLTYTANLVMMNGGYADPSAFGHMWSLSIEEQFYVAWPLLMTVIRFNKLRLVSMAIFGATVAPIVRVLVSDGTVDGWARQYYGIDTRADGLLIGCALAALMHGRVINDRRGVASATFGLAMLTISTPSIFVPISWYGMPASPYLPTVVAVGTACLIFPLATAWSLGLAWGPLMWVGSRSYALYLYHLPLMLAATAALGEGWAASAVMVVTTFIVAEASWRLLERRFMTSRFDGSAISALSRSGVREAPDVTAVVDGGSPRMRT